MIAAQETTPHASTIPEGFKPAALDRAVTAAIPGWFAPPHGYDAIVRTYGAQRVTIDERNVLYPPQFERQQMIATEFPLIGRLYTHRLIVPQLRWVLERWRELGTSYELKVGCFNPRRKKTDLRHLSLHTLGVAIDVNEGANPLCRRGGPIEQCDLPVDLINLFTSTGWTWGGEFHAVKDPMHFQFASGY